MQNQSPLSSDFDRSQAGDPLVESEFVLASQPITIRENKPLDINTSRPGFLSKMIWLPVALIIALTISIVGPYITERFQYSITRGKQRAQYELATVALKGRPLEQISLASQMISQRVGPSLVHINTSSSEKFKSEEDAYRFLRPHLQSRGQGSGVIVDSKGYIVTNYHVIRGSNNIDISLSDGRNVPASIVGFDEPTDLAVLKIDADHLIAAKWGDSDQLEVGALVWAAGSPFGLDQSITFGILSAKHRAGKAGTNFQDFLQTDAAVNPGNSGGPLVDSQGRIIGINTAIVGETYQGISFAIPSNVVRHVYERILAEGHVARGWLGVGLDALGLEQAQELGLKEAKGAIVVTVRENSVGPSPAKKAGVKSGDVIIRWNGKPTDNPMILSQLVAQTPVGSRAQLTVFRDGQELKLEVTVGERSRRFNY